MILAAIVGTALLFGGSIFLVHLWTSVPLSVTLPPPAIAAVEPPPDVTPPAAVADLAVPHGVPEPASSISNPRRASLPASPEPPEPGRRGPPRGSVSRLKVSFKLDPRLTQGLQMGERWVSPTSYVSTQKGSLFIVQARAAGIDAEGRSFKNPTWSPAEPDMVAVSREQGRQVEITVLRTGQSRLVVSEGGARKTLTVKADQQADVWQVEISQ